MAYDSPLTGDYEGVTAQFSGSDQPILVVSIDVDRVRRSELGTIVEDAESQRPVGCVVFEYSANNPVAITEVARSLTTYANARNLSHRHVNLPPILVGPGAELLKMFSADSLDGAIKQLEPTVLTRKKVELV